MFREQKHQRPLRDRDLQKFLRTLKYCAVVVAGNDFLASFAEACGRRTIILPTPVGVEKYYVKKHGHGSGLTCGWVGLSDGLAYCPPIQPALRRFNKHVP